MRILFASLLILSVAGCAGWEPLTTEDLVPADTMARVKAQKGIAPPTLKQREVYGILAEFPGHIFRGEPAGDSETVLADFQQWSWTEDGEALLIRHALEDGSYGGDTIVRQSAEDGILTYIYNTNAGFSTQGKFSVSPDGTWEALEDIVGQSDVTKVRSRGYRRADGALISASEYLKNGEWTPGHSFVYVETDADLPELQTPVPK